MNERFPFPKRYWIYLLIIVLAGILLICNILRIAEYGQQDWKGFIIEEIILVGTMGLCGFLGGRIAKKRKAEIMAQWEADQYLGIQPGEYDYVWFDFACTERALIRNQGAQYRLHVQEYDERTGNWDNVNYVSVYDSLEAVKKALLYEFDFYCDENAEQDKYGEEIPKY